MPCRGRRGASIRHNQDTSRSLIRHTQNRVQSHNRQRTVLPPIVTALSVNTGERNLVLMTLSRAPHANSPNQIVGVQPRAVDGRMLNHALNVPLRRRKRSQVAAANCGRALQARSHLHTRNSLRILRARMHHTNDPMVASRTDILLLFQGEPGHGTGERHYEFVLRGKFLRATNKSVYPQQEKNPKWEVHASHW